MIVNCKRDIRPQWFRNFFQVKGGSKDCDHEFDDDICITDFENGASHHCLHCGAVIEYDFSDSE